MAKKKTSAYAAAGVDIDAMTIALNRAKRSVKSTQTAGVLSGMGSFGGMFKSPGSDSILVSSTDGVGTKLKVAHIAGRHDTVGQDLVNHCVNDILVQGAKPLFFLDYLGTSRLEGRVFGDVIAGLSKACKENGCALLGGETAEMPGLYPEGEYDLVGTIVGAVPKSEVITGKSIKQGDVIIGLPSTGLHTNGYSLARQVIFTKADLKVDEAFPGMKSSVADVLLKVHKSYLKPITKLQKSVTIQGLAHITGGGVVDNIPRVLPSGLSAEIDRKSWKVPTVFQFIQEAGRVERDEMYRVFNMGIGMVVIVRPKDSKQALHAMKAARPKVIGQVMKGKTGVQFSS